MGSIFNRVGILSQIMLGTALAISPPVAAQNTSSPQTSGFPEWIRPYLYNKTNREPLKPALSSEMFVVNPKVSKDDANAALDKVIANPKANSTLLSSRYAPYAEDCVNAARKNQSATGLRDKFQDCLYETVSLSNMKLLATARTVEQAELAGVPAKSFKELQTCQTQYAITPGQREGVTTGSALAIMNCVNKPFGKFNF